MASTKTCAGCALWGGDETSYLGKCNSSGRSTAFDATCGEWTTKQPILPPPVIPPPPASYPRYAAPKSVVCAPFDPFILSLTDKIEHVKSNLRDMHGINDYWRNKGFDVTIDVTKLVDQLEDVNDYFTSISATINVKSLEIDINTYIKGIPGSKYNVIMEASSIMWRLQPDEEWRRFEFKEERGLPCLEIY